MQHYEFQQANIPPLRETSSPPSVPVKMTSPAGTQSLHCAVMLSITATQAVHCTILHTCPALWLLLSKYTVPQKDHKLVSAVHASYPYRGLHRLGGE